MTPVDREEIDDEAKKKRKKSQRNKSKPKEKDSSVDESEDDKTILGLRKSRKNSKRWMIKLNLSFLLIEAYFGNFVGEI